MSWDKKGLIDEGASGDTPDPNKDPNKDPSKDPNKKGTGTAPGPSGKKPKKKKRGFKLIPDIWLVLAIVILLVGIIVPMTWDYSPETVDCVDSEGNIIEGQECTKDLDFGDAFDYFMSNLAFALLFFLLWLLGRAFEGFMTGLSESSDKFLRSAGLKQTVYELDEQGNVWPKDKYNFGPPRE